MKRALSPTFVLLFLSLACISSSSAMDVVRGQLARDLNSYLVKEAETSFSGVVLIAKGGEVILHRAYGQSDVEKPRANSVDTVFDIGSVSQIFTAITILRLEEAGALSTSDPITRFLPAVPEDKRRITIHHLLSHSSGLPNQHAENEFQMMNLRQAGDRILQAELAFGPGQGYAYSNTAYTLLAALVETIVGRPFQDYVKEVVLEPAGMRNTGFRDERRLGREMARGYQDEFDRGTPAGWPAPTWAVLGSGGLVSTAEDLYRLHDAIEMDRLLQPENRMRMETAYSPVSANTFFGYGWQLRRTPHGIEVGSAAAGGFGFNALFRRVVDQGLVVIVLANRSGGEKFPILPVSRGILDLLLESGLVSID